MALRNSSARALLLALVFTLVALPGKALADEDTYGASVVTSTTVTAKSPIRVGQKSQLRAVVATDAAAGRTGNSALAAAAVPTGSIRFSIDGEFLTEVALDGEGVARTTAPASVLPEGTRDVRADYVPSDGSVYMPSFDTTTILVTDGGSQGGPSGDDGLLPNAGGPAFWLILLALGLLAAGGSAFVVGRRRSS